MQETNHLIPANDVGFSSTPSSSHTTHNTHSSHNQSNTLSIGVAIVVVLVVVILFIFFLLVSVYHTHTHTRTLPTLYHIMGWFGNRKEKTTTKENNASSAAAQETSNIFVADSQDNAIIEDDDGVPFNAGNRASDATKNSNSFAQRVGQEIRPCQPWFRVDDMGRTLDVPESFAPASCYAFLYKLLSASVALLTIAWCFNDSEASFYLAYFTSWGVVFVCIYFLFSVFNTILASRTPQPPETVGFRIRFTWFFFELATHTSLMATTFYWPLVFDPKTSELSFLTLSQHGGLLLLILIDGMLVNRIPMRLQHYYGILMVDVTYIAWTLIHSFVTDIGNPDKNDNDPTTNDDAIYSNVLEWNNDWKTSLFWACIVCFIFGPLAYLVLWCLSTGCLCCKDRRKYVDSVDERDVRPTVDDVEEGSIFAKWR